ncbi:putative major sperm protein (MSP) [Helianthus anomalus]
MGFTYLFVILKLNSCFIQSPTILHSRYLLVIGLFNSFFIKLFLMCVKLKTTNPKKYCVRPDMGIISPRSFHNLNNEKRNVVKEYKLRVLYMRVNHASHVRVNSEEGSSLRATWKSEFFRA